MAVCLAGTPFDLVIFDMDGVLVSTSTCHEQAYSELWQQLGITGPDYETIAGRITREVISDITSKQKAAGIHIDEWTRFKQERARNLIRSADICFSDTVESLNQLSTQGVQLALGTAASRETAQMILERYDLKNFFSIILTAGMVRSGKPAPDIYNQIIREAGVVPARALVVEDSMAGLEAAIGADCCAVSVRTGIRFESERFIGALPDLTALLDTLEIYE